MGQALTTPCIYNINKYLFVKTFMKTLYVAIIKRCAASEGAGQNSLFSLFWIDNNENHPHLPRKGKIFEKWT